MTEHILTGEALEYASHSPSSFEDYEQAYHQYMGQEAESKYHPAISVKALFSRPKLPILSYAEDFIYAGSINLIGGEPKAGKSTLAWHLISAIAKGDPFLGGETRKTNVLYVTEQNEVSFRHETENIPGFSDSENIFALLPENWQAFTWNDRLKVWGTLLESTDSGILVIDTFGAFAELPPNGENDAAAISQRLMFLKSLFKIRPNLGVIIIHHVRKPSQDPKLRGKYAQLRDVRGSSALVGGVDHCVMLSKDGEYSQVRNVHIEGRFGQEQDFEITLTESGYKKRPSLRNGFHAR
jgi:hypothetical protein